MTEDEFADFYKWKNISDHLDLYPNRPKRNQAKNADEEDYKVGSILFILSYIIEIQPEQVPDNREVELIFKWKEVNKADNELQKTRSISLSKIAEFGKRWAAIEKGKRI